uniref:Regulatory factor X8 n=1 Tax=Coturnix japonica TaxID=93934 RepID=A0A8C2Y5F6_COTJA
IDKTGLNTACPFGGARSSRRGARTARLPAPGTRYPVPGTQCPVPGARPPRARVAASKGSEAREPPLAGKERLGAERLGSARPARDGGGQPHLPPAPLHHPLLIRLVFPGLGTRRLGTRGSARYHYDGIAIKKDSSFYGRYCFLLSQKNYRSADACSSGDAAGYESNSKKRGTDLHCFPSITYLKTEEDRLAYVLPEFGLACPWEQELLNKYPYEMVIQIANEYNSHCQDILQVVKMQELDKVEDCITSFWKSLQPEKIAFISLPDICQLFKYYDRYLFKEMDNILLGDFLEEVSVHYLKSIRTFSKNVKLWLLNALEELPMPLQTSKCKEVTVFIKRLRRKTDLSNMAKTMRIVLNNYSKVTVLISDLNAVISQGLLDVPGNLFQKKYGNPDELRYNIEIKCLNDLLSSLAQSTEYSSSP